MSNDNFPRNIVVKLDHDIEDRNKQIISFEKEGYVLKQISAYGMQSTSGCYAWFQKKAKRKKQNQ